MMAFTASAPLMDNNRMINNNSSCWYRLDKAVNVARSRDSNDHGNDDDSESSQCLEAMVQYNNPGNNDFDTMLQKHSRLDQSDSTLVTTAMTESTSTLWETTSLASWFRRDNDTTTEHYVEDDTFVGVYLCDDDDELMDHHNYDSTSMTSIYLEEEDKVNNNNDRKLYPTEPSHQRHGSTSRSESVESRTRLSTNPSKPFAKAVRRHGSQIVCSDFTAAAATASSTRYQPQDGPTVLFDPAESRPVTKPSKPFTKAVRRHGSQVVCSDFTTAASAAAAAASTRHQFRDSPAVPLERTESHHRSPPRVVRFGTTRVYEHALTMSDHDLLCPLQLDWARSEHVAEYPAAYYGYRSYFANTNAPKLTVAQRRQRLGQVYDLSLAQVKEWELRELVRRLRALEHEMNKVQKQLSKDESFGENVNERTVTNNNLSTNDATNDCSLVHDSGNDKSTLDVSNSIAQQQSLKCLHALKSGVNESEYCPLDHTTWDLEFDDESLDPNLYCPMSLTGLLRYLPSKR